ncbi:MAG: hypothetical protein LKG56_04025 [Lachnospiraceae bacterium]|jgi:hypothetical protein|nr:hypothetical protein [Lachnospiraceae bacterium]MCH4030441.1 hypothetical protein [Lachnospiraceae bacterium]MCH4069651.1 hypothetical protein [Lachnospiraceae bacterium]MCH4107411.1 hypothetical protein [Lachnospiraceae bacterium]MCI1301735.1 hypothetical protein [Lachnospiraceae bacterium]
MNSGGYTIPAIFLILIVIILIDMRSIRATGRISGLNLKDPQIQKKYNCKKAEKIQYALDYISIIGILAMMGLDYVFSWTQFFPVEGYLIVACFVGMAFLPIAKVLSRIHDIP